MSLSPLERREVRRAASKRRRRTNVYVSPFNHRQPIPIYQSLPNTAPPMFGVSPFGRPSPWGYYNNPPDIYQMLGQWPSASLRHRVRNPADAFDQSAIPVYGQVFNPAPTGAPVAAGAAPAHSAAASMPAQPTPVAPAPRPAPQPMQGGAPFVAWEGFGSPRWYVSQQHRVLPPRQLRPRFFNPPVMQSLPAPPLPKPQWLPPEIDPATQATPGGPSFQPGVDPHGFQPGVDPHGLQPGVHPHGFHLYP